MRSLRRGVALVAVMLVATMLYLLAMAFLTKQKLEHQTTAFQAAQARGRALAEAGLEEALAKLDKDYNYPPLAGPDQPTFTYTEELIGADGQSAGHYCVTINQRFRLEPLDIVLIEVTGEVGDAAPSLQRSQLLAYVDVNPAHATCYQVIQVEWQGGL